MSKDELAKSHRERVSMITDNIGRVSISPEYRYDMRQWMYAQARIYRRIADGRYAGTMHEVRLALLHRARLCEYLARTVDDDMSISDWHNGEDWMTQVHPDDDDTDLYIDDGADMSDGAVA